MPTKQYGPAAWDGQRTTTITVGCTPLRCASSPQTGPARDEERPDTNGDAVEATVYTDGSSLEGGGSAGAAVVWSDELAARHARRPQDFTAFRTGRADQFPAVGSGAALAGTYRASSVEAEMAAAATAVLMWPEGAAVRIRLVTDSKVTMDGYEAYNKERSQRRRQRMAGRAYYEVINERLRRNPRLELSWVKVRAHDPDVGDADVAGNHCADALAKHLARRGTMNLAATKREPLNLRSSDGPFYCATTAQDHAEGGNLHVTGNWRQVAKDHAAQETRTHALAANSSQARMARGYTEGDAAAVARGGLGDEDAEARRAKTFFATATALGRSIRGARGTARERSAHATDFFVQLVSGTLPTLAAVEQQHGSRSGRAQDNVAGLPDTPDQKATRIAKVVADHQRTLQFANAGLGRKQGPDGARRTWSALCPLCRPQQQNDDQEHFVTCPEMQSHWARETTAAIRRAVTSSSCEKRLRATNKTDEVTAALTRHLLAPGAHPTRRCGLGSEGYLRDAFKSAFVAGDNVPDPQDLVKNLRLELLTGAADVFSIRKTLLINLNRLERRILSA